jgi:hypothetical protein
MHDFARHLWIGQDVLQSVPSVSYPDRCFLARTVTGVDIDDYQY